MNNEKDELKECIAREFEEIAKEEEESLEKDTSLVVPEGTKEAVLARLKEQMSAYEMEQTRKEAEEREEAINHLSEEDRESSGTRKQDAEGRELDNGSEDTFRKESSLSQKTSENISGTGRCYRMRTGNGNHQHGRTGKSCTDGETGCWR
ncbi:MAG: hypothetical protein ACLUTE_02745 [Dorea longicatena]